VPNLTRRDLRSFLPQYDLPDTQVDTIIYMVRAWLLDATDLDELPAPLPEILWASALELAALVADNPVSQAQKTIGPTSRSWPMRDRKDQILERVRERWRRANLAPVGVFPPPPVYPDDRTSVLGPDEYVVMVPGRWFR
jgi:hypothetical protein